MMNSSPGPILKADPRARRITFFIAVALLVSGVAGTILLQEFFRSANTLAAHAPEKAIVNLLLLLKIVIVMMGVSLIGFGVFSTRLALRTIRTQQFPPPGTRVLRDSLIVTGRAAQRHGKGLLIISAVLFISGILVPSISWRILSTLFP